MAYRFRAGKITKGTFRRVAAEQIAHAQSALGAEPVDAANVHRCRKVVKRLRSLLRLFEGAMSQRTFKAHNRELGEIGRALSGLRDAHVLELTIAGLEAHYGEKARTALAAFKDHIGDLQPVHTSAETQAALAAARAGFAHAGKRLAKLKLSRRGFNAISDGLRTTYGRMRAAQLHAYAEPSDENFHELRKAVQWHWRHLALLSDSWPEFFNNRARLCRAVGEKIGNDHDLAVLIDTLSKLASGGVGDPEDAIALARARQGELRAQCRGTLERLCVESPKAFTRRVEGYWRCKAPPETGTPGHDDATPDPAASPGTVSGGHVRALATPRLAAKSPSLPPSQQRK